MYRISIAVVIVAVLQSRSPRLAAKRIKQANSVWLGRPGHRDVSNHAGKDSPGTRKIVGLELAAV